MTAYTMDPDRTELLERRCERLERMIRILQNGNIDNQKRIAELEKAAKPTKLPDLVDYETYQANGGRPFGDQS